MNEFRKRSLDITVIAYLTPSALQNIATYLKIFDLIEFLHKSGVNITVYSDEITMNSVIELSRSNHSAMADCIEADTSTHAQ